MPISVIKISAQIVFWATFADDGDFSKDCCYGWTGPTMYLIF